MEIVEYPLVSIMIATYNSAWILRKPLDAIRRQSYPQDRIEILIIDGGSTDETKTIAQNYGCKFLNNPDTDPVSAKFLGLQQASGRYLMTIDHDEVLSNPDSIAIRISALMSHPECKVALLSGYKCPKGYAGLNEYISEFGDPFSMFFYHFSAGYKYYRNGFIKYSGVIADSSSYSMFEIHHDYHRIIVELICLGAIIDLSYFRNIHKADINKNDITHLFYKMVQHGETHIIQSKEDPLEHYSTDSLKKYLPKLRWRIINNVHYADRASQGFTGRNTLSASSNCRKFLYPFYSISLIFPIADSIYLSITRKNITFLLHPFLCIYVTFYVIYQFARKLLHLRPQLKTYDGKNINTIDITSH